MTKIGGNVVAEFLAKTVSKNGIGEQELSWKTVAMSKGFLDLVSGTKDYTYLAKAENSTHVFLCDFFALPESDRVSIDGRLYDINYVDDPMRLGYQLEIYLTYIKEA